MGCPVEGGMRYLDLDARIGFCTDSYSISPQIPGLDDRSLSISLVLCPLAARLKRFAPVLEPTSIRPPTIRVMAVNASAPPRRRTFWKWQWRRLVTQEAFITQPRDRWARPGRCDNADRVPLLFDLSRQLRLRHHLAEV